MFSGYNWSHGLQSFHLRPFTLNAALQRWSTPVGLLLFAYLVTATALLTPSSARAEAVSVVGAGSVSLKSLKCDFVTSSFVERLCFDQRRSYMLAQLNGTWYHYCGVSLQTYRELINAPSIGRYLNERIRGQYDCVEKPSR